MAAKNVFERHEKKYLLAPQQFPQLYSRLLQHLAPDEYGRHTICSLYFDTAADECAHRQIDKLIYREKLRLRSYGVPKAGSTVYLELKKKLDGVTYKRRMPLPIGQAQRYFSCGAIPQGAGQVFGEIDWFVQQNNPLPKTLVCYDRVALCGIEDPELRITFDENIRYRSTDLYLSSGEYGHPLCRPGEVLMEIKITGAMPLWLARLLSSCRAFPTSFSKFRSAYQAGLARRDEQAPTPYPMPHTAPSLRGVPATQEVLRHA